MESLESEDATKQQREVREADLDATNFYDWYENLFALFTSGCFRRRFHHSVHSFTFLHMCKKKRIVDPSCPTVHLIRVSLQLPERSELKLRDGCLELAVLT